MTCVRILPTSASLFNGQDPMIREGEAIAAKRELPRKYQEGYAVGQSLEVCHKENVGDPRACDPKH